MPRAWKLHDNVNTDEIIPGRYNVTTDRASLAKYCLCEVRPDFPRGVQQGDIIVGGRNFGCGSSREHAPIAIQECGVAAILAPSFARIFYRNAVNIGLPVLTCADAGRIEDGDDLEVDVTAGLVTNRTKGETYRTEPLPPFVAQIAEAGGILNFVRDHGWDGVMEPAPGVSVGRGTNP